MNASSKERLVLLLILAYALVLRLLLWSQPLHEPANDEVEYITVARDLLDGRGWSFYDRYHWLRAPLYPLFLAASWGLAGDDGWPRATRALHLAALPNILLSVLSVSLAYALTARLVNRRAALLAALITATLWTHATFASLYMSETLFTVLFQIGLLGLVQAGDRQPTAKRWLLIIAAGVALGLAALTRSLALLFLPIAAGWLAVHLHRQRSGLRHRPATPLLAAVVLLASAGAVIAPWTIRNYQAYGGFILIETGLSYNLWVFNEPHEDRETIHRILENISNPVERANDATERGLERLREDPMIIARKLWPNWVFLARIKPIQDRFLMESYYADVDLPLFVAALIFDDLLYVLIAFGAIVGLTHAVRLRRQALHTHQCCRLPVAPAILCLLWIGYAIATMLLTHGEARYRHFLFPALIPYAAWTFTALKRGAACFARGRVIAIAPLMGVFLWTVLTAYPWGWAVENLTRGSRALAGDVWMALGAPDRAADAYLSALAAKATPDGWLRLGAAHLARGDIERARVAYRAAWDASRAYYIASAHLGDLERSLGNLDEARRAFAGAYADEQRVLDWSWRMLGQNPPTSLDVGDGLDFGYVGGVYPAEELLSRKARWSAGRALLRLGGLDARAPVVLTLRLAAPHPNRPGVPVRICITGTCRQIEAHAGWRTYTLMVERRNTPALVEVHSPTFMAADGRRLGVIIDWAAMIPLTGRER
ncbi:phospholipid carrier-dependent glycosyltransferase [Roseiflexus sp.]|uniref:phospholipid carrier-dependent glycosyltransferase n=1 Tax=Roseiflexus sp. TaxID=2562120 RepID=UPI0021DE864A|nr:glycosyltransferase family 39 protein [Roseiflexus sp.]GIW01784.1 MAG: hypothetical protein KatS3mg058_3187 [Roseiflexus sp.]